MHQNWFSLTPVVAFWATSSVGVSTRVHYGMSACFAQYFMKIKLSSHYSSIIYQVTKSDFKGMIRHVEACILYWSLLKCAARYYRYKLHSKCDHFYKADKSLPTTLLCFPFYLHSPHSLPVLSPSITIPKCRKNYRKAILSKLWN